MTAAPPPSDESARLRTLRSYEILDTIAEPSFDRVTALVARILEVPIALVSLVDAERQWFKSCIGLGDLRETGRDVAFCAHAIHANDVFVIPDATADPRFVDNSLVTGPPHIRSYAGAPLVTPNGARVGTLCAIDTAARDFSGAQLATLVDLAAVVVDEMELRRSARERKLFERVSQLSPNLLYLVDTAKSRIAWSNKSTQTMLGYRPGAIGSFGLSSVLHPDDVERGRARMAESLALADGESSEEAFRVRAADGGYRWLLTSETPFERDDQGKVVEVLGIAVDVTALKDAEDRASRSERELANRVEVLEAILEAAGEGVLVVDADRQVIIANPIARDLISRTVGDTLPEGGNRAINTVFHEDGSAFDYAYHPLDRSLRGERADNVQLLVKNARHPDGVYLQASGRPVVDQSGEIRGAVVTLSNVTELKLAQRRLSELAVTDELTRLPNRRALRDRLDLLAMEAARGRRFSVAIVDIDHFKRVNDTHGHAVGDEVLVAVAGALRATVRRSDLVVRMGGEEFCVVQTDIDVDMMQVLTERLRTAIAAIQLPVAVTASVGVCHSVKTKNPVELLAEADGALYRAKHAGRNRIEVA